MFRSYPSQLLRIPTRIKKAQKRRQPKNAPLDPPPAPPRTPPPPPPGARDAATPGAWLAGAGGVGGGGAADCRGGGGVSGDRRPVDAPAFLIYNGPENCAPPGSSCVGRGWNYQK
jgi:hypothetical protein